MRPFYLIVAQASPPGGITPEARRELSSATWELFIALMVLIVVVVVVMLLLRRNHMAALRNLRSRRRATEMEDLWFENPIERRGAKPPPRQGSPAAPYTPPEDDSVP